MFISLFSPLESTVFIPSAVYSVEEDIGELLIPVRRSGDVNQELMVICFTQQGTNNYGVKHIKLLVADGIRGRNIII